MYDLKKILELDKASPMMKQYILTKLENPDVVLFYRLGDFYEFFFDDAIEMSKVLDLTLTGKDCNLDDRAPMCGIPYHAAEGYINKLISLGYKVGICEQTTDPKDKKTSKDIVKREVVRIVTAGTVIDEALLDEKRNNYIACIYNYNNIIGFSYLDITTGEFKTTEFNDLKSLNDALVRILPSEILCYSNEDIESQLSIRKLELIPKFTYNKGDYDYQTANMYLSSQFGGDYEKKFSLSKMKNAIIACGVLLNYLKLTQKRDLTHINNISLLNNNIYMSIDVNSRRSLEIMETMKDRRKKGSLIGLMDKTKTSMGARLIRSWIEQPLLDIKEINDRLNGVEEFCGQIMLRDGLTDLLNKINDIERISGRISYGNFNPRDCLALGKSLELLPKIKQLLSNCKSNFIKNALNEIKNFNELTAELNAAIIDNPPILISNGGFIKKGYCKDLDEYQDAKQNASTLISMYESHEKQRTGIKNLKVGFNRVYGYYIEINKTSIMNIPLNYIRKQTVANNERYITEDLKNIEDKILQAEENSVKLEQALFNNLRNKLITYIKDIQSAAKAIAKLDCILSFANLATKNNYCKPKITKNTNVINIIEGRHPVVEDLIHKDQFIPNNTLLDNNENRTMIITGPNMAGKSTYMRQVALITLMAHIGSFVPAKQAEISLTDKIFTRVGASDDLALGQSTFMVEMMEVSNILKNATDNSLILLDEIGRGTSTFDGLSIAWSIVEYLSKNLKAKTLFSTHYHELTELENFLPGVKNYKITVKEFNGNIVFLRKITRGGASRSFGIEVANLAGVPDEVIKRAKEIANVLEANSSKNLALETSNTKEIDTKKDANYTEIIGILKDTDINTLSPLSAFNVLCELIEKVKK